jgi:hypothetical protein
MRTFDWRKSAVSRKLAVGFSEKGRSGADQINGNMSNRLDIKHLKYDYKRFETGVITGLSGRKFIENP